MFKVGDKVKIKKKYKDYLYHVTPYTMSMFNGIHEISRKVSDERNTFALNGVAVEINDYMMKSAFPWKKFLKGKKTMLIQCDNYEEAKSFVEMARNKNKKMYEQYHPNKDAYYPVKFSNNFKDGPAIEYKFKDYFTLAN